MGKISIVIFTFLLALFLSVIFSTSAQAALPVCFGNPCTPGPGSCCAGASCTYSAPKGGWFCGSSGAGLTPPTCAIRFTTPALVGKQLNIEIDAGDNGEVYFSSNPKVSGSCINLVGYCSIGGNVCNTSWCTNVCSSASGGSGRMYTVPVKSGPCTVTASVYNSSGPPNQCQATINVACPATMTLSGNFYGNPSSTCVDVFDNTTTKTLKGTYCGTSAWKSIKLPSGKKYLMIPHQIPNYTVSPSSRQTGLTCDDNSGNNFTYKAVGQHKACVNNACQLVNGAGPDQCQTRNDCAHMTCLANTCKLVSGAGNDLCTNDPECVPATHLECVANTCQIVAGSGANQCSPSGSACGGASIGYFETFGGNLIANGALSNQNLPSGKAYSGLTTKLDAGVVVGSPIVLPPNTRYSDNGTGLGFHLNSYTDQSTIPTYDEFLTIVLGNARLTQISDIPSCPGGGFDYNLYKIRFWCYTSSANLNQLIDDALTKNFGVDILYHVFVPDPNQGNGGRNISLNRQITKTLLVFVSSSGTGLSVNKNVLVNSTNPSAGLVTIVEGDLDFDSTVSQVDGFHLFSGVFDDQNSDVKLEANGSLVGTDNLAFSSAGLLRTYTAGGQPAEKWTFDGRYLSLYKNLLARPKVHWQELPPQ